MNNANYRISLDVHDACSQVTLRARKAEDGRTIYATLTEQGRPYTISEGCSAEFVCLRPNGKKLKNECIIEGNVIRYDLTKETVITTGVAKCEFRLTDATGKLLTSPMFSLEVWSTIYTEGDAVESEIANMSTVKSANPGYSEVFMWSDGNPNNENRVGYFVGEDLERSAAMVKICNSDSNIRGVSMAAPGFASNAPGERYDENSALRPQYCYVGLLGFAPVIDHGACAVNGRCRPGDDGTAVPDDSGGGYLVVERLDEERVLILMEQAADMMIRVRKMMTAAMSQVERIFTVNVGTEWTGLNRPYFQTISVNGLLESDIPFVDLKDPDDYDDIDEAEDNFAMLDLFDTQNNKLLVRAKEKTSKALTIRLRCFRVGSLNFGNANYEATLVEGPSGSIVVSADGEDYPMSNAELGAAPSSAGKYSFEIL